MMGQKRGHLAYLLLGRAHLLRVLRAVLQVLGLLVHVLQGLLAQGLLGQRLALLRELGLHRLLLQ